MNIALIGSLKSNASTINSLSEKLTTAGNTVRTPSQNSNSAASTSVDSDFIESFERIDWADMIIAIPKEGLSFTHDITAQLAYAKHRKKSVFIYYR